MQNAGMEYLESRLMFGMVPGLTSTRKICAFLGNPEKKFKSIHVVGTNGKGSSSFYLAGILKAHGLKTGLYTSPHLVSIRERIRVDDLPISNDDLNRLILKVKYAAEQLSTNQSNIESSPIEPTFFEVLTIVAFLYYAEQNIDVAILEAGMGGRLDSTAVACGDITMVTSIGLEHTEILGATENDILKEKMLVMQKNPSSPHRKNFVLGRLTEPLYNKANELAIELCADIHVPEIRKDILIPNLGQHYVENASLSIKTAELFLNSNNKIYHHELALNILKKRSWAGRMQMLYDSSGKVQIILDGAHNSHAVTRLVETLDKYYHGQKFQCLFGALKDKDMREMLKLMGPYISEWHITKTKYPRFRELSDVHKELENLGYTVMSEGELTKNYLNSVLKKSKLEVGEQKPLLITGSLYMIGAIVQLLKNDFEGLKFFRGMEPSTNEHR